MKIPFDIKYRPQIESGKYKVVTEDDEPARIICWDSTINKERPIIAIVFDNQIEQYKADGRYDDDYDTSNYDLFIITPEPELSEFEFKLADLIDRWHEDYEQWANPGASAHKYPDQIKEDAAELLALARKELCEQIVDRTKEAYENGKAEALKDLPRWRYKKGGTGPILHDCILLNKYGCIGKSPSGALLGNVWILEYDELAKLPKEDSHE